MSYRKCLERLQLPLLKLCRDVLTVCFIYETLHNMLAIIPESIDLSLGHNNIRSEGVKLFVSRPSLGQVVHFLRRRLYTEQHVYGTALHTRNLYIFEELIMSHWCSEKVW